MRENKRFEDQIRSELHSRVDQLYADEKGFLEVKVRLSHKEDWKKTTRRILEQLLRGVKKPAAAVCCAALALMLMCSANPSLKVWADENIQKMSGMIYVAIKGDDNKYESVQIPAQYTENGKSVSITVDDSQAQIKYKAPAVLDGGYLSGEETSDTAAPGKTLSKFYRKDGSELVLNITQEEWMMDYAKTSGDNKEILDMGGVQVYYFESPLPIYPLIKDVDGLWTNDLTQPPTEIKTNHQFTWEYKGVSYQISDLGNGSYDEMKKAVDSLVRYQLDK